MAKGPEPGRPYEMLMRSIATMTLPLVSYPLACILGTKIGNYYRIGPKRGASLVRDLLRLPPEDLFGALGDKHYTSPAYDSLLKKYFPEETP